MRLRAGSSWENEHNMIFTRENGRFVRFKTLYVHFKAIVKKMGRPEVRFHDVRHPDVKQATKNNEYLVEFLKIMRIDTLLQGHYSPFLSSKASWRVVSISIRLS